MGDWKISTLPNKPWELFNMAQDRTESTNLAEEYPEKLKTMSKAWDEWAKSVGIRIRKKK